jgi:hypothetical protein
MVAMKALLCLLFAAFATADFVPAAPGYDTAKGEQALSLHLL